MFEFEKYEKEIDAICTRYDVKTLTVFGSALSDAFNDDSDLDFLLELNSPINGLRRYMNVKFELEELLQRPGRILQIPITKLVYFHPLMQLSLYHQ